MTPAGRLVAFLIVVTFGVIGIVLRDARVDIIITHNMLIMELIMTGFYIMELIIPLYSHLPRMMAHHMPGCSLVFQPIL